MKRQNQIEAQHSGCNLEKRSKGAGGWRSFLAKAKKNVEAKRTLLRRGTPEGTRTPNIQNRNLTLYPIELRTHIFWMPVHYNKFSAKCKEKNLKGARFYLQKIIPLFVEIWYDKQD